MSAYRDEKLALRARIGELEADAGRLEDELEATRAKLRDTERRLDRRRRKLSEEEDPQATLAIAQVRGSLHTLSALLVTAIVLVSFAMLRQTFGAFDPTIGGLQSFGRTLFTTASGQLAGGLLVALAAALLPAVLGPVTAAGLLRARAKAGYYAAWGLFGLFLLTPFFLVSLVGLSSLRQPALTRTFFPRERTDDDLHTATEAPAARVLTTPAAPPSIDDLADEAPAPPLASKRQLQW